MRSELEEVIIGLCEGEITRQHPVDAVGLVHCHILIFG
jgi:hypothetical protein